MCLLRLSTDSPRALPPPRQYASAGLACGRPVLASSNPIRSLGMFGVFHGTQPAEVLAGRATFL